MKQRLGERHDVVQRLTNRGDGGAEHQRYQQQKTQGHDQCEAGQAGLDDSLDGAALGVGAPDRVQGGLHLAEHATRGNDQRNHPDQGGDNSRTVVRRAADRKLQETCTLRTHGLVKLGHQRTAGGLFAVEQPRHRDDDQQHRADRRHRVESDGSSAGKSAILDEPSTLRLVTSQRVFSMSASIRAL
jgi:hypothetical protein